MDYLDAKEKQELAMIKQVREMKFGEEEILLLNLYRFDWYYSYSDDLSVWRAGEAGYKSLLERVEALPDSKFKEDLQKAFKGDESRDWLWSQYPWLKYYSYRTMSPKGLLGMAVDNCSLVEVTFVLKSLTLIEQLLNSYNFRLVRGYKTRFIYTEGSPTHRQMRDACVDNELFAYNTLTVPESVRIMDEKLSSMGETLKLTTKYFPFGMESKYQINLNEEDVFGKKVLTVTTTTQGDKNGFSIFVKESCSTSVNQSFPFDTEFYLGA